MTITNPLQGDRLNPRSVAAILQTSAEEVAAATGLQESALRHDTETLSDETQRRLYELAQLFEVLKPRFYSSAEALAWYRSRRIPRLGGRTPEQLVREGKTGLVLKYIESVDAGVYA